MNDIRQLIMMFKQSAAMRMATLFGFFAVMIMGVLAFIYGWLG